MNKNKEITIYDIARTLNISASTVSRGLRDHEAINKETRKKIHATAQRLGYQHNKFASNLRKKRTNTIGLVLPRLDSNFMSTVISGIEQVAKFRGYNLIISQSEETYEKEKQCIATMFNSRVDGLLFSLAYDTENLHHLDLFYKKHVPVVYFDRVYEHPDFVKIVIDNFKAGYEITNHLIDRGCKRIVHLGGNLKRNVYRDRFNGYKKALKDHDIPYDESLVSIGLMNENAGIDMVHKMLKMNKLPDGIFASNDISAVACIYTLKQYGVKIPDEVCVAGFNNVMISKVIDPGLTTIYYPGKEMGEIAATTLINIIEEKYTPKMNTIILKHELVIRQSTLRNGVSDESSG